MQPADSNRCKAPQAAFRAASTSVAEPTHRADVVQVADIGNLRRTLLSLAVPPSSPVAKLIRRSLLLGTACVTMIGMGVTALTAAQPVSPPGGPTVNLNEPVTVKVTGPVEVQGAVEIGNDALKTPYFRTLVANFPTNQQDATLTFPAIPAGKRLVVESFSVRAVVPTGQSAAGWMAIEGLTTSIPGARVYMIMQLQATPGDSAVYFATHPVTLRIDPAKHKLQAIGFRSGFTGAGSFAEANITGYLEDL